MCRDGPPRSWRLVDWIQGDEAGGEQVESEKVVDFFQVFGRGNKVSVRTHFATGQGDDL